MFESFLSKIGSFFSDMASDDIKDRVATFFKDMSSKNQLRKKIQSYLVREEEDFLSGNDNFDFEALRKSIMNCVFDERSLTNIFSSKESDREIEFKTVIDICIQDAHANSEDSCDRIKHIIDQCYNIVFNFYFNQESTNTVKLFNKTIFDINEHTTRAKEEIIDNSNQNYEDLKDWIEDCQNEIVEEAKDELLDNYKQEYEELKGTLKEYHGDVLGVLSSQKRSNAGPHIHSDNKSFFDSFNNSLFLDQDDERMTLREMYIEPLVKNGNETVSEYISKWMKYSSNRLFILYGDAGSGKSSLVAKLVDDSYKKQGYEDEQYGDQTVLAIALRKHYEVFNNFVQNDNYKINNVIQCLFGVHDCSELTNKLLILDGLDELTVLVPGFDLPKASNFITLLSKLCSSEQLKILITSRNGYFQFNTNDSKIKCDFLCWKETQVENWCKKFCTLKPDYQEWTNSFLVQYRELSQSTDSDRRSEILCVPFVLYLCCHSRIDLEHSSTVCQIYDDSFRKILRRAHAENLVGSYLLEESRKEDELRIVYWQFTKEIAYQMFLISDLTLSDVPDSNTIQYEALKNAKQKTKDIVHEKYNIEIEAEQLQTSKLLGVLSFAKDDGYKGITFAHKSVYEYFAAVKIYEDYFADLNEVTLNALSFEEQTDKVLQNTFEAFRYKAIQNELFDYLCGLCTSSQSPFGKEKEIAHIWFNYDFYLNHVLDAMNNSYENHMSVAAPQKEYIISSRRSWMSTMPRYNSMNNNSLYMQLSRSFANLTWFLTKQGFDNSNSRSFKWKSESIFIPSDQSYNIEKWDLHHQKMKGAFLIGANLTGSNLTASVLSYADLRNAYLSEANMFKARLSFANLKFAHLPNVCLDQANLKRANLMCARMKYASLQKADLSKAELTEARLPGANLRNAILQDAKLYHSFLVNADLSGADLRGADLRNALIHKAIFKNAKYSDLYNCRTLFPEGFNPTAHGMILDNNLSNSTCSDGENNSSDKDDSVE